MFQPLQIPPFIFDTIIAETHKKITQYKFHYETFYKCNSKKNLICLKM
ncbi:hypothetical protein CLOM621_07528 [Clostridium sp. M62/1]|nr:hypothetical protein CLOM621_07528 [Clostridium sp. M62/1]